MTTKIKEFDHIFILLLWHMAEQQKPEVEQDTIKMKKVKAEIDDFYSRQNKE